MRMMYGAPSKPYRGSVRQAISVFESVGFASLNLIASWVDYAMSGIKQYSNSK